MDLVKSNGDSDATRKVCRVCLAMGVKMYHMSEHKLSVVYERVTGVEITMEDKLPKMLCWECVARLSAANQFIRKALKTHLMLINKMKGTRFVSMDDIEFIDKAELKSALGVKLYRDNYSDIHIMENCNCYEQDSEAEFFEPSYVDINNVEEQIFVPQDMVSAEKDPIKREYSDETVEQEIENDIETDISNENVKIEFQNVEFKTETLEINMTENASDEKELINNESNASGMIDDEDVTCVKDEITENYELIRESWKRERSEALPHCMEPRVVEEDVMSSLSNHNTYDSFNYLVDNAQSTRDNNEKFSQGTINEEIVFTVNDFGTHTVKASKYIDTCENSSVCDPVNNSISSTHNAIPSNKLLVCDKPLQKHTNTDFTCKYCSYETSFKSRLKYHINTKHPKSSFNCAHCDFVTNIKRSLIGHINAKHTKNIVHNCSYCNYKTYFKPNLNTHINNKHTKKNIFKCSYCNYKTYIKSNLNTHTNTKHTKISIFNCSFCDYKVYNKLTLSRHVNAKHTKTKVFNCSYCSFTSYRQWHLNAHVNAKHTKVNVK